MIVTEQIANAAIFGTIYFLKQGDSQQFAFFCELLAGPGPYLTIIIFINTTVICPLSDPRGMDSRNEANAISVFDLANRPIIIAHRGYSKEFPENTLLSFRYHYDFNLE